MGPRARSRQIRPSSRKSCLHLPVVVLLLQLVALPHTLKGLRVFSHFPLPYSCLAMWSSCQPWGRPCLHPLEELASGSADACLAAFQTCGCSAPCHQLFDFPCGETGLSIPPHSTGYACEPSAVLCWDWEVNRHTLTSRSPQSCLTGLS